ncbi:hypothetical protein HY030_03125 [Candidatus Gottesmanbacteria bacterium]|nr:hypothetical protein [Candidatus Gottesmanbacteria bacterium]
MTTQNYVCPNCRGKGCPVCQNTGQVALSEQEVSELQKLMTKPAPFQASPDFPDYYPATHEESRIRGQLAGALTLVFLAVVSISGFLSWFFTKTFKPFFQFWSVLAAIAVFKPLASLKFFQEEKVNDFVGAVEEEGIKISRSPWYPLL